MRNAYNGFMSKGIGKLQRDILDFLENHKMALRGPISPVLIAWLVRHWVKPDYTFSDGAVNPIDPEELALHHSRMQSIRRALRGLHERGLVVKFALDGREYQWMATSVYEAGDK